MGQHERQSSAATCPRKERAAGGPTVTVIVPVHNGGEAFRRCLDGIRSADPPPDEVLVVADGSTDGSAGLAERLGMRVVHTARRSGPAAARNLGARVARGDVLLFIDADVAVDPSTVARVRQAFRDHPEVSGVIGTYDDTPAAPNFLSQYKNLFQHYIHQHGREEGYTFWGACGAIRRAAFFEVGGYDEVYRQPCIEDIELGYRLKAAGHRLRICKALQVKHYKRWDAVSLFRSDFFRRALPWTALILRSGRIENDLNIDRSSRAKVALVYGLLAVLGLACWWAPALLLAPLFAAALLALDAPLLRFFRQKRGLAFALRVVPWQWFYYWYSGLAFALGLAAHLWPFRRANPQPAPELPARPVPADGASRVG